MSTALDSIAGLAAPARRALAAAGYQNLEALDGAPYATLAALHGVGGRGLERLQAALVERGMSFGGDLPQPAQRSAALTPQHTGTYSKDITTKPTAQSPDEYIDGLDTHRRVEEGRLLLKIFNRATGEEPVMWGPTMVGYGQLHYRYGTGREGDTFRVGFSPRKAKISLYGMPLEGALLARLGKYTTGASCLYVNKLADIDLAVLEEMVRHAWYSTTKIQV